MSTKASFPIIALVLLFALFAAGVSSLLLIRLKAGDMFPVYSSLRGDPLGVEAFYEALEMMPGISVERNYRSLSDSSDGPPGRVTLFYLGLDPDFLKNSPSGVADELESLAKKGARIVLSFRSQPFGGKTRPGKFTDRDFQKAGKKLQKSGGKESKADQPTKSAGQKWEVSVALAPSVKGLESDSFTAHLEEPVEGMPPGIPIHTALYFKNSGAAWRTLYAAQGRSVLVERPMGAGSMVLLADSYLLSNEAMLNHRLPGLLCRLAGPGRLMVFDEYHLGIAKSPGVVSVARRHRLHYLFFGLIVVAGLFLWRNAVPLVPPKPSAGDSVHYLQMDQTDGLVHLLRRNIGTDKLIEVCLDQWEKSATKTGSQPGKKFGQAGEKLKSMEKEKPRRSVVEAYREIARILKDENRLT
ncbi:MAG: hypothetical protein P4L55_12190 [Syntrophobacteraceae bacterium]|nr:hypothetical protein [Syntrophobacteraceae bacterium]